MRTQERLTTAYKNARVEYFDENSKYIFFSDCHRGNGGHQDEFTKNQNVFMFALYQYFANGYTFVEVGDGDELWEHPKFKVLQNAHYHDEAWIIKQRSKAEIAGHVGRGKW